MSPTPHRVTHRVTLAAGTTLAVRIGETISPARSKVGDSFLATLEQQLVIDGFIIAERGARIEGRVLDVAQSRLSIELVKLETADRQRIRIRTVPYKKDGAAGFARGPSADIPVETRLSFRVEEPVLITEKLD
jgi:hypothetical protein